MKKRLYNRRLNTIEKRMIKYRKKAYYGVIQSVGMFNHDLNKVNEVISNSYPNKNYIKNLDMYCIMEDLYEFYRNHYMYYRTRKEI